MFVCCFPNLPFKNPHLFSFSILICTSYLFGPNALSTAFFNSLLSGGVVCGCPLYFKLCPIQIISIFALSITWSSHQPPFIRPTALFPLWTWSKIYSVQLISGGTWLPFSIAHSNNIYLALSITLSSYQSPFIRSHCLFCPLDLVFFFFPSPLCVFPFSYPHLLPFSFLKHTCVPINCLRILSHPLRGFAWLPPFQIAHQISQKSPCHPINRPWWWWCFPLLKTWSNFLMSFPFKNPHPNCSLFYPNLTCTPYQLPWCFFESLPIKLFPPLLSKITLPSYQPPLIPFCLLNLPFGLGWIFFSFLHSYRYYCPLPPCTRNLIPTDSHKLPSKPTCCPITCPPWSLPLLDLVFYFVLGVILCNVLFPSLYPRDIIANTLPLLSGVKHFVSQKSRPTGSSLHLFLIFVLCICIVSFFLVFSLCFVSLFVLCFVLKREAWYQKQNNIYIILFLISLFVCKSQILENFMGWISVDRSNKRPLCYLQYPVPHI